MFNWKKLGHVFDPSLHHVNPWMSEYAQCPTPVVLNDDVIRVYVASRPKRGSDLQYVSYPGYVDLDRHQITRVVGISSEPILTLGKAGAFDEFGIMPSSFVRRGDAIYMYYSGWTRARTTPYTLAIGVAVSRDGGNEFARLGDGPTMGLSLHEPYFVTGPIVRADGDNWQMWYLNCLRWEFAQSKAEPIYRISHATSKDGLVWMQDGKSAVTAYSDAECQDILAPFYFRNQWHAIFAWRDAINGDGRYRLGHVESADLRSWERDDARAGIQLSSKGWDSEMMCYPQVLQLDGRLLLFYCGNEFGKGGFGIAELTDYLD
jgi:hypothetical protein